VDKLKDEKMKQTKILTLM